MPGINDDPVECKSLALVNRDGPCRPKGYLGETSIDYSLDFIVSRVKFIPDIVPFLGVNTYVIPFFVCYNKFRFKLFHCPDLAVVIS